MRVLASLLCLCVVPACSGAGANEGTDSAATSATDETSTSSGSSGGETGDPPWPGGGMLACDTPPCTFLFVTETLDDRVEVFAPDTALPYRGTLEIDLKPNDAGNTADGRLDEPYEALIAGGFLHLTVGHYPSREAGSALAFPLELLAEHDPGSTIATAAYFEQGTFGSGVIHRPLSSLEPIFVHRVGGRIIVGVFNNDLFALESAWTSPGKLLILDATDPAAAPGEVILDDLMGSACAGAGELVRLDPNTLAVACDGNEAVALLDVGGVLAAADNTAAAAAIISLALCDLPPTDETRVRHLAATGDGAVWTASSPIVASVDPARLWRLAADCSTTAIGEVSPGNFGGLGQLTPVGNRVLVGGALGRRGVFVATKDGPSATVCGPLAGLNEAIGDTLEPLAIRVNSAGTRLAVGAGPTTPDEAGPGLGKVLWAELDQGTACPLAVTAITDLTDGQPGHAPVSAAGDPATWRRGPNVLLIHEVL